MIKNISNYLRKNNSAVGWDNSDFVRWLEKSFVDPGDLIFEIDSILNENDLEAVPNRNIPAIATDESYHGIGEATPVSKFESANRKQ